MKKQVGGSVLMEISLQKVQFFTKQLKEPSENHEISKAANQNAFPQRAIMRHIHVLYNFDKVPRPKEAEDAK